MGDDIVDRIDELVDWQLGRFDSRSGYDHNVNQVDCPHSWCREPWHGLAITTRMREMRGWGHMDPDYKYANDTSEVLCPGSEFEGEFTPPERRSVDMRFEIDTAVNTYLDALASISGIPSFGGSRGMYQQQSSRWPAPGVLDMTAVDSLRNLRCQAGTQDAAYAEYLREHVRYSFAEEVARRYPGVQLDPAEIRTEYRQEPHGNLLVAWWEPAPVSGTLEGGHAHGRLIDEPTYGSTYRTAAPVLFHRPTGETAPLYPGIDTIDYERAGYDTVTRRWVYKPRQPAPRATVYMRGEGQNGWQELGTLAEPIRFQPSTELDDATLALTPGARSFTATFDIADVSPDFVRLLQGDDNPADEPAVGDQAA